MAIVNTLYTLMKICLSSIQNGAKSVDFKMSISRFNIHSGISSEPTANMKIYLVIIPIDARVTAGQHSNSKQ